MHRLKLSTVNAILVFLVMNFVFVSFLIGLIVYAFNVGEERDKNTQQLTKEIHETNIQSANRTDALVNKTIQASNNNYQLILHRANVTNQVFARLLSDHQTLNDIDHKLDKILIRQELQLHTMNMTVK